VDVITGVIKANFPARISFKVASKVDSRTVLDTNGADKLLGKGDLLFLQPGEAKLIRGQGAFVVDEEIARVVEFVSKQKSPEYHPEIDSLNEGKGMPTNQEKDELFDDALRVVLETGVASSSTLQRRLRLGYTRAARIIDQMEAERIVGPHRGSKPREILVDRTQALRQVASQ
jgi:S-DNA-T family DNA segregation ATPase FtsK/SpoIIIE